VKGTAHNVADPEIRNAVREQFVAERKQFSVRPPADDHDLFEFSVGRCLLTKTSGHGDVNARKLAWHAKHGR
jgi:hypothetical protein